MRSSWRAELLGPAFVGLTEGIWVAVLYLLFETVGQTPVSVSPVVFVAVAAIAALGATRLALLGSARWQVIGLVVVIVGALGMLSGPGVLATVLAGHPADAFGSHPGGWLLGLAAFRGLIGVGALDDPDRAARPFVRGVIALALIWLYAGLLPAAGLAAFRSAAIGPTVIFATVGLATVGLRRVDAIAIPAGIEWWRNLAWLAALAGLIVVLGGIAIPFAGELTRTVPSILGLAGLPEVVFFGIFVVWLTIPRDAPRPPRRTPLRSIVVLATLIVLALIVYRLFHGTPATQTPPPATVLPSVPETTNDVFAITVLVATLVVVALVAILFLRNRRRPMPGAAAGIARDRSDLEFEAPGLGWLRRARRRWFGERSAGRPRTAETAYLATLELLEPVQALRRQPVETPRGHAQRLRREGSGKLDLELLAADFELAHYGARDLPLRETRRAISRWERSRTWIAERILAEDASAQHAAEHDAGRG